MNPLAGIAALGASIALGQTRQEAWDNFHRKLIDADGLIADTMRRFPPVAEGGRNLMNSRDNAKALKLLEHAQADIRKALMMAGFRLKG